MLKCNYRYYIRHYRNIEKEVNNMNDKELLKTIQNDIENIDICIEMCDTDEGIDYLKSIQKDLRKEEIEIVKKMALKKALKKVGE